jgi:hypothetical protein
MLELTPRKYIWMIVFDGQNSDNFRWRCWVNFVLRFLAFWRRVNDETALNPQIVSHTVLLLATSGLPLQLKEFAKHISECLVHPQLGLFLLQMEIYAFFVG